ncbi:MAG: prepilin-type N-terminal cleavage/methylation domain-containing protein [Akkermansiaceae bacterium]|nr:prepilin-type N-terminal cleavage/methylation domain-containing protein [Akkermansiaceae bacterium]MCP5550101.1 prepilin-type N-terminal cleavage/methylation domain-containing protein [Akkermansiaceae bacterium]
MKTASSHPDSVRVRPFPGRARGFTFVEMLVAISMSAIFLGAAALIYQSISVNSKRLTTVVEVDIGSGAKLNFYDQGGSTVRTYSAPNYGRLAQVQNLKEKLRGDLEKSESVFCLPRSQLNTIRPEFLDYTAPDPADEKLNLDSPEAFRQYLLTIETGAAAIFDDPIRNVPSAAKPSTTIFLLGPQTEAEFIRVVAVYDIDLIVPTGLDGIYASVRRYKNGSLTDYYDAFFANEGGDAFRPGFVAFESEKRAAKNEGVAIDRFKVAPGAPFYLLFLPDPSINALAKAPWTAADPATSPRQAYEQMAGKTSFVMPIPMFPAL